MSRQIEATEIRLVSCVDAILPMFRIRVGMMLFWQDLENIATIMFSYLQTTMFSTHQQDTITKTWQKSDISLYLYCKRSCMDINILFSVCL